MPLPSPGRAPEPAWIITVPLPYEHRPGTEGSDTRGPVRFLSGTVRPSRGSVLHHVVYQGLVAWNCRSLSRLPGENHATPGEKEVNPQKERSQETESGSPECHPSGLTTSHQLLGYLVMEANKFLLNLSHLKLGFCQWQPES